MMDRVIPQFQSARVLVVGDLMLDRYWSGTTWRISPEAPVPIVRVSTTDERPGGAGNVALNVRSLGGQCALLATVGCDEAAALLERLLKLNGVDCQLQADPDIATIIKLRVLSQNQQLIRLDFENDRRPDAQSIEKALDQVLKSSDVVVFSDYDKGTLSRIEQMIKQCRVAGKTVLVDPKAKDYRRYRGAHLLTPNWQEFTQAVGGVADEEEAYNKAGQLIHDLELDGLLITRGQAGMIFLDRQGKRLVLEALAQEVFDVTGAGDTVMATLASALAAGVDYEQAVSLANTAAGIVVAKLGSATVSVPELKRALKPVDYQHKIVSESALMAMVAQSKANHESIVMTNGCFDILHQGHVQYLNQAAALGDRLIVAVNVDDTVKALKGESRPIHPLSSRMAVLAALHAVDWVVAFTEPTPKRLICAIQPNWLVKGGDNDPKQIPGSDCVRAQGGQVRVLEYIDGCSTSQIIDQLGQKKLP